jgi:GTP cyclohydrolase II
VGDHGFLSVERTEDATLAAFDAPAPAPILISGRRAATLKLTNQREARTDAPVLVRREAWIDLPGAMALADPSLDLARPMKGPFHALPVTDGPAFAAALKLARLAGLLPALFVGAANQAEATVGSVEIMAAQTQARGRIVARAPLPTLHSEQGEVVAFRADGDPVEHIALILGKPDGNPPLVRLHSECLTGDVLGSLKCDCGPQLERALKTIAGSGWGILLYLRQEGRAIGLINKLRAYALQDQGFDTYEANLRLGFDEDERDFATAAGFLHALGQERVRLITNNPRKAASLIEEGIEVTDIVGLGIAAGDHNRLYLEAKKTRGGHRL